MLLFVSLIQENFFLNRIKSETGKFDLK